MPHIEIYTKPTCPYCQRAKALFEKKGLVFTEIDIAKYPERRPEMIVRSNGRTTVPEIFIDGQHIGGCDDLYAAEESGELDNLLSHRGEENDR